MVPPAAALWRNLPVYQIYGANTNVGKTLISTILCNHLAKRSKNANIWYLKPVSTGPLQEADTRHLSRYAPAVKSQNFYQFASPVSPHLAAQESVPDQTLLGKVLSQIQQNSEHGPGYMFVETAGGPHSPGPSGTSQVELYRPLRLPSILVADWHLGGISTSVSSFESLVLRGLDVVGVVVIKESFYKNFEYIQGFFEDQNIPCLALAQPPEVSTDNDEANMKDYYSRVENETSDVEQFVQSLDQYHENRLDKLDSMRDRAHKTIWYPFTQHKTLYPESITAIDSAYCDYFQTLRTSSRGSSNKPAHTKPAESNMLQPSLDGSSSWWTQGFGHANPALTLSAAYAAGRYGHVMFAEAIHEPAMSLAENILDTLANPRLSRVFYSDNGSTGTEVGVKMALRAACARYDWNGRDREIEILGLQNSYHGDTIGSMDMSEPSVFNEKILWYEGRGFWFDSPSVTMKAGKWIIQKPASLQGELGPDTEVRSLQDVFEPSRDSTNDAAAYEKYIRKTIQRLTQEEQRRFGALVMEPVVLGAGGMILVDPLFQRTLVKVVRSSRELFSPTTKARRKQDGLTWQGLPVLADEVFTGLYRLGHKSSCSLLGIQPDISVHAKLLTGGLIPLAVTLASESIFEAFLADGKADSLLHGHSYTAHAVGCAVANKSLDLLRKFDYEGKWDTFKADWSSPVSGSSVFGTLRDSLKEAITPSSVSESSTSSEAPQVWSCWSAGFITTLSHATDKIDGVWALGSVLSIALKDAQGGGYASNAARTLQQELKKPHGGSWNIHSRVLGNVLYLMTSQTCGEQDVRLWEERVKQALRL